MAHLRNSETSQGKQNFKLGLLYSFEVLKIGFLVQQDSHTWHHLYSSPKEGICQDLVVTFEESRWEEMSRRPPHPSLTSAVLCSSFFLSPQTGFRLILPLVKVYSQPTPIYELRSFFNWQTVIYSLNPFFPSFFPVGVDRVVLRKETAECHGYQRSSVPDPSDEFLIHATLPPNAILHHLPIPQQRHSEGLSLPLLGEWTMTSHAPAMSLVAVRRLRALEQFPVSLGEPIWPSAKDQGFSIPIASVPLHTLMANSSSGKCLTVVLSLSWSSQVSLAQIRVLLLSWWAVFGGWSEVIGEESQGVVANGLIENELEATDLACSLCAFYL